MPKISLPQLSQNLEVPKGKNLMLAILESGLPIASSCGGDGVCAKCKVEIVSSAIRLPPPSGGELVLKNRKKLQNGERLACQITVESDLEIRTSYW